MWDEKYQQKSKSISSAEPNYFVHFALRHPVGKLIVNFLPWVWVGTAKLSSLFSFSLEFSMLDWYSKRLEQEGSSQGSNHVWKFTMTVEMTHRPTFHVVLLSKGQLNSEWIDEVIVCSKMPTKNYRDFFPGSLLLQG